MKQNDPTHSDWNLIEGYCNQTLEPGEFAEFEKALRQDARLRKQLRQYLSLDAALRDAGERAPEGILSFPRDEPASVSSSRNRFTWALGWAAILVLGLVVLRNRPVESPSDQLVQSQSPEQELRAQGYGILTGEDRAQWTTHPGLSTGDLMPSGPVVLESGLVQLELFSGVTLVIEGPSRFELSNSMEMVLTEGRVRAHVPGPARGFKILSAHGQVIDLGTEFAMSVGPTNSEVHVLQGEVEWHFENGQPVTHMQEGQAVRVGQSGASTIPRAGEEAFVGMKEMRSRLDQDRQSRSEAWEQSLEDWLQQDRLLAFFGFSNLEPWDRILPNQVGSQRGISDGAIVGGRWFQDRFGQAGQALDFSPTGSRVRLNVQPSLQALTFMAWVKIDSLDRWYNSLLLTDGHELHEPHWQIMNDGRLFFSVKARHADRARGILDKHIVYSPPFWNPSMSGRWLHVAVTFDVRTQEICHYLNGDLLHQERLPEDMQVPAVHMGAVTIGNWSEPTRLEPDFAVRNLNGSIDDFAILSQALSPAEIASFYQLSRP